MTNFSSAQTQKHKAFVSFHSVDQYYRDEFDRLFGDHYISKSVDFGDIDPDNSDEYIKRLIREDNITDSSVLFALYGAETHKRKHVDWEIFAGLSGNAGGHSGLAVVILPTFPVAFDLYGNCDQEQFHAFLHPRVSANLESGFADLYFWPGILRSGSSIPVRDVLDRAFEKRITHKHHIDNSAPQYRYNR